MTMTALQAIDAPIVLLKDGKPIDISTQPSLLAALHQADRGIRDNEERIASLEAEIPELEERIRITDAIGMPTSGIQGVLTRRQNALERAQSELNARTAGYMEIPNLDGDFLEDEESWGARLDAKVPMDALRAIQHAKETGLFDHMAIRKPFNRNQRRRSWGSGTGAYGGDPIVYGMAGGVPFYVAGWR